MPEDSAICERNAYYRGSDAAFRDDDYVYARSRATLPKKGRKPERGYKVACHFAQVIAARSRNEGNTDLAQSFREQVDRWKDETGHLSSITRAIAHPSYLRIIGMGKEVLPILLKELREHPDHWLVALNAITGEDPAPKESNFTEAVAAWIKWGEDRKLC
jgi:hypothetical protein